MIHGKKQSNGFSILDKSYYKIGTNMKMKRWFSKSTQQCYDV